MSKSDENKRRVPKLRFPGFTEDWEQRKFSDFAQRESLFQMSSYDCPSVEYEDVIAEEGCLNKDIRLKEVQKTGIKFDGTQVLYGKLRPYLHNWLNPDFIGVAVGDWWVLRPVEIDKNFLYRLIQTKKFDNVANQSSGSKMPRADWNLVSQSEFIVPISLEEQCRIAEAFEGLDHLITLHQRKCDRLKELKKGLLQKMFPKNGEKIPELRFSGFTEDWEQRKVSELCSISTGKSNTQDKVEDGEYPFYVRSAIIERSNKYLYDEEAVLTVGDGVGTGKVFHYVSGKYDLHQRCYRMYDFTDELNVHYFYHTFSKLFYKRVMAMTAKTSVDSVRLEMIADMEIPCPKIKEQEKIGQYLDNLDNLITLHQRKLDHLKELKKGLLQQMFV